MIESTDGNEIGSDPEIIRKRIVILDIGLWKDLWYTENVNVGQFI